SLVCSTLVGGSSGDWAGVVALDPSGNPYVGGWTRSNDFSVTAGAIQSTLGPGGENSFIAALSFDVSTVLYGSYFGGDGSEWSDYLYGLAIDRNYNIYIAGATGSANFQTTPGAFQVLLNGDSDAFIGE